MYLKLLSVILVIYANLLYSQPESCEDGFLPDCSGDGDCCSEEWLGDGLLDCEEQEYGCDLTCYDNDGGDCDPIEGCTEETAGNYNPNAEIDDGSCECSQAFVQSCSGDFYCVYVGYIGDGWCQDGSEDSEWPFDLTCYENDGAD